MSEKRVYSIDVAGRPLVIETGELAKQANASVLVRYGETAVLVTATATPEAREEIDFLPLRVDYEERQYAAGRIPGSFFRREGRPSERAILCGRLIDRPIRPLFPKGFRNEVQVIATAMSFDGENFPELCGIMGASAALTISDIPFEGPIAGVMIGMIDGELVLNPAGVELLKSDMELMVAGTRDAIIMVEAEMNEIPEERVLEAIEFAHQEIKRLVAWQEGIAAEIGKPKMQVTPRVIDPALEEAVRAEATGPLRAALFVQDKAEREAGLKAAREQAKAAVAARLDGAVDGSAPALTSDQAKAVDAVLDKIEKEELRRAILEEGRRADGRGLKDIRPISCRVGILPRTHGTGLFTRGQPQVLTVASLGSVGDRQEIDAVGEIEGFKRYMHHYNFPPFSTGEVKPIRSPGRREIGHGALAERALVRMIPPEEVFPYTIRLVSEVLESNGSSSMASVCGSTLALMDAGVPIKAPVAGIAMGLIKEGDRFAILSDIQGIEDFLGDMDFKVAGTRKGVTAIQMDIKIAGLDRHILQQALAQAREGRLHIMDRMLEVLPAPRPDLSPHAPRIIVLTIHPDKIREVIGPGGKMINKIQSECGVDIDIEDDGKVFIAGSAQGGERAAEWIRDIVREVAVGETFLGKVTRIQSFGAFVELLPGKEGLVRIGELALTRIPTVESVVSVGDRIMVRVIEIDELGRVNLSRRVVLQENPDVVHKESRNPSQPAPETETAASGFDRERRGMGNGRDRERRAGGFGGGERRPVPGGARGVPSGRGGGLGERRSSR